jgi:hypothetical protein
MKPVASVAIVFALLGGILHLKAGQSFEVWVWPFLTAWWIILTFIERR